jgi:hypothetical protein
LVLAVDHPHERLSRRAFLRTTDASDHDERHDQKDASEQHDNDRPATGLLVPLIHGSKDRSKVLGNVVAAEALAPAHVDLHAAASFLAVVLDGAVT